MCPACRDDLPTNHWCCRTCALPLAFPGKELQCGDCLKAPPPYDRSRIPWRYQYPVDSMISRYKYHGQRKFVRPLVTEFGAFLAEQLEASEATRPDCLIPAPMLPSKRRKRGFNQAKDIAEHLGRVLDIPVNNQIVHRRRQAMAQQGLNREQRLANLQGVFEVENPAPERLAIVDDVVTTGATVRLLASLLRDAGAKEIEVWALARTPG
ncbi:ComF family protein [Marinobacter salinexigens]|uniref:ComF family protein n=1 Tax=Marinobacter salinexigens TaxID=2919747 RepID=UPI001FE6F895|nr:ComF family protein [Marinobacter salinexigens]